MGKPKKRTSSRRTGMRRSHQLQKLAKQVNAKSPVAVKISARQRRLKLHKKTPKAATTQ